MFCSWINPVSLHVKHVFLGYLEKKKKRKMWFVVWLYNFGLAWKAARDQISTQVGKKKTLLDVETSKLTGFI